MKKQYLEAGRITNTHGVAGEVRIEPWADSPDFLLGFKTLYIDGAAVGVARSRAHKGTVIAKFGGMDSVSDAMRLKNKVVYIDRADAELPPGGFFIQDIIGAAVTDEDGRALGTLEEVLDLPAGNVYVVRGEREILIPAVPAFILSTDVENGVIRVRLMEGL